MGLSDHSQFDPMDPVWRCDARQRQATAQRKAERERLLWLVCACVVTLATLALWRLGPMPAGMLP